jgi:hypothetical protein
MFISVVRNSFKILSKMKLYPKESGEFIVANAKHVEVHEIGIKNLSNQVGFKVNFHQLSFLTKNHFITLKDH